MKIEKISVDDFKFSHDGTNHILDMGLIDANSARAFVLKISDLKDAEKTSVRVMCGCTKVETQVLNKTTLLTTLAYVDCDYQFTKTVKITEGTNIQLIKITGTCQNQNI